MNGAHIHAEHSLGMTGHILQGSSGTRLQDARVYCTTSGNVLTSINVSTDTLLKALKKPMVGDVCRIASMFHEHQDNLENFLTQDLKGKQIPSYLGVVAESLSESHQTIQGEIDSLVKRIDPIKHVIISQQDIAHAGNIREAAAVQAKGA